MNAVSTDFNVVYPVNYLPVVLDGVVLGYVALCVQSKCSKIRLMIFTKVYLCLLKSHF